MGCATLAAAAVQGPLCVAGALVLAALGAAKLKFSPHGTPGIRNVPGLKDLAQAFAPALLAIGLPGAQRATSTYLQAMAALTVLCLALTVHSLRHLRAFHEDRILGKEILPVAIGSVATRWLAAALLLGALSSLASIEWIVVR
jgi:1,4-dihydroxy-2-naphthoate octaprenyltransferase